jgi:hypothetical protein
VIVVFALFGRAILDYLGVGLLAAAIIAAAVAVRLPMRYALVVHRVANSAIAFTHGA